MWSYTSREYIINLYPVFLPVLVKTVPFSEVWLATPEDFANITRLDIHRKRIASQHWWSTVQKYSSNLVWPTCKFWSLFLVLCSRIHVGTLKILTDAGVTPLCDGDEHDHLERSGPTRYCTKFARSGSNRLGGPKIMGMMQGTPPPWDGDRNLLHPSCQTRTRSF